MQRTAVEAVNSGGLMRAIPKSALHAKIRNLDQNELQGLELATDEALGRVEPNLQSRCSHRRPFVSACLGLPDWSSGTTESCF